MMWVLCMDEMILMSTHYIEFCRVETKIAHQSLLSLKAPNTTKAECANTVDPDEKAHNHLDPQCFAF